MFPFTGGWLFKFGLQIWKLLFAAKMGGGWRMNQYKSSNECRHMYGR